MTRSGPSIVRCPGDAGLINLQTKVDDLAAAERICTESAELLRTDTAAATLCLSSLSG